MKKRVWPILTFIALIVGFAFPALGQAQGAPGAGMPGKNELSPECKQMMEQRQAMKEEMDAMDAKLQELADQMNAASGEEKVEAMAAVVNQLVAQQQTMRRHMETMGPEMMKHMSAHMGTGAGDCTKMQEGEEAGHERHHPAQ